LAGDSAVFANGLAAASPGGADPKGEPVVFFSSVTLTSEDSSSPSLLSCFGANGLFGEAFLAKGFTAAPVDDVDPKVVPAVSPSAPSGSSSTSFFGANGLVRDSVFFAKGFAAPAGDVCPKGEVAFFSVSVASSVVSSESPTVSVGFEAKGLFPPDGGDEKGFVGDALEVSSRVPFEAKGLLEDTSFLANGFEADGGEDAKGFTGDAIGPLPLCEARSSAFTFSASSFTCHAFSSVAFNSATIRSSSVTSLASSIFPLASSVSSVASEFSVSSLLAFSTSFASTAFSACSSVSKSALESKDGFEAKGLELLFGAFSPPPPNGFLPTNELLLPSFSLEPNGLDGLPIPGVAVVLAKGLPNGLLLLVPLFGTCFPAELAPANELLLLLLLLAVVSLGSFFAKGLLILPFCRNPSPTFAATPTAAAPAADGADASVDEAAPAPPSFSSISSSSVLSIFPEVAAPSSPSSFEVAGAERVC